MLVLFDASGASIDLVVALAHPLVVLPRRQVLKQKLINVPGLLKVVPPNISPHLLAGQNRDAADVLEVDEDEFAYGLTEILHGEVSEFVCVSGDDAVGDVVGLVVAQVLQVLLVDVALAIFPDDLDVLVVEDSFGFVVQNFVDINFAFVLAPQERKYFIDNIGFKIFINVPQPLGLFFLRRLRSHLKL